MYNPSKAGSGNMGVWALRTIMGESFLRELAKQEPLILGDHRLIAEWVARGKYPVGIFISTDPLVELKEIGAPLQQITPKEGVHISAGSGYLSLPKKAPHPNASRLFINWLLSKEGQTVYVKASKLQSAREDVSTEFVMPSALKRPGIKYYNFISEEELLGGENREKFAMEIFGHLIDK